MEKKDKKQTIVSSKEKLTKNQISNNIPSVLINFDGCVMPSLDKNKLQKIHSCFDEDLTKEKAYEKYRWKRPAKVQDGKLMLSARKITASNDAEYFAAVESGDMIKAKTLVNAAAQDAGYTIKAYYGTDKNPKNLQTKNYQWGNGYYFTESKDAAFELGDNNGVYFLNGSEFFDWDNIYEQKVEENIVKTSAYNSLKKDFEEYENDFSVVVQENYDVILNSLLELGYKGIIISETTMITTGKMFVVFDIKQIKSADPVTYDDSGNIIPLSKRFNLGTGDVRANNRNGMINKKASDESYGQTKEFNDDNYIDHNPVDQGESDIDPNDFRDMDLEKIIEGYIEEEEIENVSAKELIEMVSDETVVLQAKIVLDEDIPMGEYNLSEILKKLVRNEIQNDEGEVE